VKPHWGIIRGEKGGFTSTVRTIRLEFGVAARDLAIVAAERVKGRAGRQVGLKESADG